MILDKNTYKKVKFCVHPPMEFLYAMYDVAKEKELYAVFEEFNFTPDEEVRMIIGDIKNNISSYNLQELKYFFYMTETIGHILPSFIINNPQISDVQEMISTIENSDEKLIMFYLVRKIVIENSMEYRIDFNWEEVRNSIPKMIDLVSNISINNKEIKEKLIECLMNPMETKQRYCIMLKGFYNKAYKYIEKFIIRELNIARDKYEEYFKENSSEFFKTYFKMDLVNSIVHISFFKHTGWSSYGINDFENIDWIVLGVYSDRIFGKDALKERANKFFKVLSDKKRIKMIELLAQKPWYGHEMAKKLKLTPATVSYHLSLLLELNMVNFNRNENRMYYSLNREKVDELFDESKKSLLRM